MIWGRFFSTKRPVKYAAIAGTAGVLMGGGITLAFAIHFLRSCSDTVQGISEEADTTIKIPSFTADVDIHGHPTTLTFSNIEMAVPDEVCNVIDGIQHDVPSYCFDIPLTIGMCLTFLTALSLASSAFAIGLYQDHTKVSDDENNHVENDLEQGLLHSASNRSLDIENSF